MAERKIVVDTNFFILLQKVDPDCSLVSLLSDCLCGELVGEFPQLALMDQCEEVIGMVGCQDVTDEESALFVNCWSGRADLRRLQRDPADLKLIIYAQRHAGALLLTSDRPMLLVAEELNIERRCFKAALGDMNESLEGAISDDTTYATEMMYDPGGNHPFFCYGVDTHCPSCDPARHCGHRQDLQQKS